MRWRIRFFVAQIGQTMDQPFQVLNKKFNDGVTKAVFCMATFMGRKG